MNLNLYHNKLTVICEHCGERYEILLSKKWKMQNLIIDYAVCPHCKRARSPCKWEYRDIISDVCASCGVPYSRITKHGNVCVMCYFRKRREELEKKK